MDLCQGNNASNKRNSSTSTSSSSSENVNGCFDCNICLDSCHEPVVTLCGHLYCWPCIYKWLQIQTTSSDSEDRPKCPVCKAEISNSSLVPLYGRGRSPSEPESKKPQLEMTNLPPRPPALGTSALTVDPNPMQSENEAFHQQLRNYTIGGPSATNSSFSPTINMVGEIVFAGMFGSQDTNLFAYPHANSYPFLGNGSPRLRRQEIQLDKSLNRVSIFLFCCIALCLVLNLSKFAAVNRSDFVRLYSRSRNLFAFRRNSFSCAVAAKSIVAPAANALQYSAAPRNRNLFSRISPVRHDHDVVQVLDQWVSEGRHVHSVELRRIIHDLRSRRRFSQALQVSEWISSNGAFAFSAGDCAVHLDLIYIVRGRKAAEVFFTNLNHRDKNEKTFGALLNVYVREGNLTKTLHHMKEMKSLGYASTALTYNNLMSLYKKFGQLDKVLETFSEMKKDGVAPNNFSYRICVNSLGEKSDLDGMEKLLDEMGIIDWATYSIVAYFLIKAGHNEKALTYMKKMEECLDKDALGYNHLISLYAHIGNKGEMMRLWGLQKEVCRKQINRDYITMLGSLVKLGELETAEAVLKEWELSCHTYDFRVPNVLLIGYCQKGLVEKAESMLGDIVKKGKRPSPNSWSILGAGFLDEGNFEKSFECVKEALDAKDRNVAWRPKPGLVEKLLNWLGENREVEEVEAFVRSLREVVSVDRHMYRALIKSSVRSGEDTRLILGRMRSDKISVDEIEEILKAKNECII